MALRATKGDEDARCGRTLYFTLVFPGRVRSPGVAFSLFLPYVFQLSGVPE
jgi:hypothetical protein